MQESNLVSSPVKVFFLKTEEEKVVQIKKSNVTIVLFFLVNDIGVGWLFRK